MMSVAAPKPGRRPAEADEETERERERELERAAALKAKAKQQRLAKAADEKERRDAAVTSTAWVHKPKGWARQASLREFFGKQEPQGNGKGKRQKVNMTE